MATTTCAEAPWYTAPVIVGGSGGSGTRGVAMLLEALGVGMACVTKDFLLPTQRQPAESVCTDLKCNSAADCGLISSFRTGRAVGGHGALSWLRAGHNGSATHFGLPMNSPCDITNTAGLTDALGRPAEVCGGNKEEALHRLRHAVHPKYRKRLRWGLKNPHATYYANALRRVFPCMVYVHTLRDLDVLVRTSKHFDSRVTEAVRYGLLAESSVRHVHSSPAASQRFLSSFLRRVNGGLHHWLERCMPQRYAHVSLQRLVVRARAVGGQPIDDAAAADACFVAVVRPLLRVIEMHETPRALNATRSFLKRSLPTVTTSLAAAAQQPLHVALASGGALAWPEVLDVAACHGPIAVAKTPSPR